MRPEREDHMIARLDRSHARPVLHHDAGGLVSEHHWQRHRPVAVHDVPIAHAHARGLNLQSSLIPTAVTTDSHLARSPFTNAVNSSGVDGDGTASCISNCFFNSAECSVLIAALRSLSSTSTASPAGAIKPYQLSESTVLKPASPVVGTSGKASERVADATASALIAPERMCGSSTETSSTIISM